MGYKGLHWYFNPLPPYGGRQCRFSAVRSIRYFNPLPPYGGRLFPAFIASSASPFQSTPSVWRETYNASEYDLMWGISIHSLRMEGDGAITTPGYVGDISIHSLRMEGDSRHCACGRSQLHFNPLPPHGGRLPFSNRRFTDSTFQSTPSAWRETHWHNGQSITRQFQSTPSAWRETSQVLGVDLSGDYFNPLPPHGGRPSR